MSVGKGSIARAAQAKEAAKEGGKDIVKTENTNIESTKTGEAKKAPAKAAKPAVKKAPAKAAKPAAKKEAPVVSSSVITADSIHEMKFQAASNIHCELPIYLL